SVFVTGVPGNEKGGETLATDGRAVRVHRACSGAILGAGPLGPVVKHRVVQLGGDRTGAGDQAGRRRIQGGFRQGDVLALRGGQRVRRIPEAPCPIASREVRAGGATVAVVGVRDGSL